MQDTIIFFIFPHPLIHLFSHSPFSHFVFSHITSPAFLNILSSLTPSISHLIPFHCHSLVFSHSFLLWSSIFTYSPPPPPSFPHFLAGPLLLILSFLRIYSYLIPFFSHSLPYPCLRFSHSLILSFQIFSYYLPLFISSFLSMSHFANSARSRNICFLENLRISLQEFLP